MPDEARNEAFSALYYFEIVLENIDKDKVEKQIKFTVF